MKTTAQLQELKAQVQSRSNVRGIAVLTPEQALEIIDQAIADRQIINRWFGFLTLMARRSSWKEQIQSLLDDYLYGTESKEVQQAAQRYVEMQQLHQKRT